MDGGPKCVGKRAHMLRAQDQSTVRQRHSFALDGLKEYVCVYRRDAPYAGVCLCLTERTAIPVPCVASWRDTGAAVLLPCAFRAQRWPQLVVFDSQQRNQHHHAIALTDPD